MIRLYRYLDYLPDSKIKKKKSNEHDFNRPKCTLMNLNIACKNTPHISSSYIRGFIPKSKLNK